MLVSLQKSPAQDTASDKDDAADESAVEDTTVGAITEETGGAEETVCEETQPIVSKLKEAQQEEGEVSNGALTEIDTDDSVLQREPDSVAQNESCDGDEGTPPCAEPA